MAALNRKTLDEAMDLVARKRNGSARSGLYMLLAAAAGAGGRKDTHERQYQRCKIQSAINSAVARSQPFSPIMMPLMNMSFVA